MVDDSFDFLFVGFDAPNEVTVARLELFHEFNHIRFDLAGKVLLFFFTSNFVVELDNLVLRVGKGNEGDWVEFVLVFLPEAQHRVLHILCRVHDYEGRV